MSNKISKVYTDIKELLEVARSKAYHSVNSIMVKIYWKIGKELLKKSKEGNFVQNTVLNSLKSCRNKDLFGKVFLEANLKSMRSFYIVYPELDRQCLANLSWSNIVRIIRIDNPKEIII